MTGESLHSLTPRGVNRTTPTGGQKYTMGMGRYALKHL